MPALRRCPPWLGGALLPLALAVVGTAGPAGGAEPAANAKPGSGPNPAAEGANFLRVMTLNLAHGRGIEGHQATQTAKEIAANLQKVAELIRRHRPDVVALQEADGASVWSGWFDHVQWLSDKTSMEHRYRGAHVDRLGCVTARRW